MCSRAAGGWAEGPGGPQATMQQGGAERQAERPCSGPSGAAMACARQASRALQLHYSLQQFSSRKARRCSTHLALLEVDAVELHACIVSGEPLDLLRHLLAAEAPARQQPGAGAGG